MADIDCIVAGAGVVGLAVARALALSGREVLVVDAEGGIGTQTSSRNSEVIHAGLYYPEGSAKARLCVAGKQALYAYLSERSLPYGRCGKLIVATRPDQVTKLEAIIARGKAAGVADLQMIGPAEIAALEPEVSAVAAVWSPSTGVVDSHAFMLSLQGDVENTGGVFAFGAPVTGLRREGRMLVVSTGGPEPAEISTDLFVNSAGHGAPKLAALLADYPAQLLPRQAYAKGNYFSLAGRQPFRRLIYPTPEAAGLGVHATIDLAGRVRFGPDVEWVASEHDLAVDPARAASFYAAIRSYWPGLPDGTLTPDYAGIRPKIHGPAEPMPDFRVEGPAAHGVPGFVTLFGIESPGLTASLAIGEEVARLAC
ncbi:MAG: NAD(P)/FAD-dependent oxidoreductase [Hyphomicrobiales bacterium]|jgi:L-2-hydroxyglutarate oxidase LhgO|nr:NAD(P)/FAD-dependent oxidoreductase [Hyphomicrobiales bacterium]